MHWRVAMGQPTQNTSRSHKKLARLTTASHAVPSHGISRHLGGRLGRTAAGALRRAHKCANMVRARRDRIAIRRTLTALYGEGFAVIGSDGSRLNLLCMRSRSRHHLLFRPHTCSDHTPALTTFFSPH